VPKTPVGATGRRQPLRIPTVGAGVVAAEAALAQGGETPDRVAIEVLGNIAAMESAIELAVRAERISLADVQGIHRVLMERSRRPEIGGVVRQGQNWIGDSSYNPCSAVFVPPPPDRVDGLLYDLIEYINSDEHSPLTHAAIAHAQFETLYPFADGNGRTGRALIHVILRRRGLSPTFVPPISLVLATWSDDYVSGLTSFRNLDPANSPKRSQAAHTWLRTSAGATLRACSDAQIYATRIDELAHQWRSRLGTVRKKSALDLLLDVLPGVPLLTVASAARLIYRSEVDLFTSLERALASPTGDTATDEPVRPVPQRPPTRQRSSCRPECSLHERSWRTSPKPMLRTSNG
jgi:Fic family protein